MKKLIVLLTFALFVGAPTVFAVSPAATKAQLRATARMEKASEIKARIQAIKNAQETERTALKAKLIEKIKEKATGEIERIVARYERVETRVEKMKVISDERKTEIKTTIDAKIEELNAFKPRIEAATTVEEVRTVMTELRTKVKENSSIVKQIVASIHATHLDNIVTKLTTILTKLETKGGDAAKIATAKTQLTEATAIIKTGDFKAAKTKILEARKTMIEIAQELKGGDSTTEETENTDNSTQTEGEGE